MVPCHWFSSLLLGVVLRCVDRYGALGSQWSQYIFDPWISGSYSTACTRHRNSPPRPPSCFLQQLQREATNVETFLLLIHMASVQFTWQYVTISSYTIQHPSRAPYLKRYNSILPCFFSSTWIIKTFICFGIVALSFQTSPLKKSGYGLSKYTIQESLIKRIKN